MRERLLSPEALWRLSCALHRRGWRRLARAVKFVNYFTFRCLLPPEAVLGRSIRLDHYALGVVMHPNITIGHDVRIFHGVTIAGETWIGSSHRVIVEDGAVIGVGAKIMPRPNCGLRIGRRAVVGAGAVVTHDVPPETVVVGIPARPMQSIRAREASSAA